MKTVKKFHPSFKKTSQKTAEEIKASCDWIKKTAATEFDIRSNGNHIWVESGEKKQQFWSPMLHLHLDDSLDKTHIKGEFAENPMLWLVFLLTRLLSTMIFVIALIVVYLKYRSGWSFNLELVIIFAMVSVWFVTYVISENYKRKGARQIEELHHFVDYIATADSDGKVCVKDGSENPDIAIAQYAETLGFIRNDRLQRTA